MIKKHRRAGREGGKKNKRRSSEPRRRGEGREGMRLHHHVEEGRSPRGASDAEPRFRR